MIRVPVQLKRPFTPKPGTLKYVYSGVVNSIVVAPLLAAATFAMTNATAMTVPTSRSRSLFISPLWFAPSRTPSAESILRRHDGLRQHCAKPHMQPDTAACRLSRTATSRRRRARSSSSGGEHAEALLDPRLKVAKPPLLPRSRSSSGYSRAASRAASTASSTRV